MRSTVNSYLEDYLKRGGETAFARTRGLRLERWSYRRVAETAFRFARELEARGVGKGERVLLWASNGPEWVAAFFGCALAGAVVVPLDVESAPDFVSRVQTQTKARLALVSPETGRHAAALKLPTLRLEELEKTLSSRPAAPFKSNNVTGEDLVEIIYTSGTTAEPRGVCLTHRNILANLAPLEEEIEKYLRWERLVHPVRFLCLLPLSHVFGQFMGFFVPQLLGGEVHFQDSLNPSEIAGTIKRRRISVAVAVPRMLESLREHVERREASKGRAESFRNKLESVAGARPLGRLWTFRKVHRHFGWKFWAFVTGGATLEAGTEEFWRRMGFAVVQGYGMTETASLITVNHPFKSGRGSIGRALPGQEMRLDESGEILVRGANVSPGYWREGRAVPLAEGGWLRTGDLGSRDAAGNIYFRGRKKDVIVTAAGLNVYPEDIEAALNRQPEVREAAVVGVEGARGPEPVAVLIMRDASTEGTGGAEGTDPSAAIERANDSLARHQRVRRWHVWPGADFPRTPTHKVRKREILERIRAEGLDDPRRPCSCGASPDASLRTSDELAPGRVAEVITSLASRAGGGAGASLKPDAKLATDLKLDSLGRVELLSALEDRYQIEIDEASFTDATTLGDVERIVRHGGESDSPAEYPYPEWTQRFPFTWLRVAILYAVVFPITALLCWLRVRGSENLQALRTPTLFVSNHITYFDHALILSALPGRFRRGLAIAQEGERLRWWRRPPTGTPLRKRLRWLAQYFLTVLIFNTFSLPKASGFRRSFAFAGETVDRGYSLLVFPEGIRTEHAGMNPFKGGIGVLASKLDAPVVPVYIEGLAELKLSGRRGFTTPGRVSVHFGPPVTYARGEDPAAITQDLERRVKELQYRGR
jgi:long-chain acyl-CoA synthetase